MGKLKKYFLWAIGIIFVLTLFSWIRGIYPEKSVIYLPLLTFGFLFLYLIFKFKFKDLMAYLSPIRIKDMERKK